MRCPLPEIISQTYLEARVRVQLLTPDQTRKSPSPSLHNSKALQRVRGAHPLCVSQSCRLIDTVKEGR